MQRNCSVEKMFTITQLANEFEITPRAIRFYEDKGLLSPARRGQARVFTARDRARLILILRGKRFGFSLIEIKSLMDLYERPDGGLEQLRATISKANERIAAMRVQKDDLEAAIAELEAGVREGIDRLEKLAPNAKSFANAAE